MSEDAHGTAFEADHQPAAPEVVYQTGGEWPEEFRDRHNEYFREWCEYLKRDGYTVTITRKAAP